MLSVQTIYIYKSLLVPAYHVIKMKLLLAVLSMLVLECLGKSEYLSNNKLYISKTYISCCSKSHFSKNS
jgi:hypothetical protein